MASTLLLDVENWDLVVNAAGDIAVATEPYSIAQDAASAIKLFIGELFYDVSQGVRYRQEILGKFPPIALIKADLQAAALTVPGVVSAQVFITRFENRKLEGQVQVTSADGTITAASF